MALLTGCGGSDGPYNVLLVTVDSLRADRVGPDGPPETPAFDSLLSRGTRFTSAYTPMPEAVPALASLHTGLYPVSHGVRVPQAGALPQEITTLAEVMRSGGYRTAAFVGSISLHPKYGLDQGFDLYGASYARAARPSLIPEAGLDAARVVEPALEFLETARDARFFLWVNFHDPHYFYDPPKALLVRHRDSPYDGEVANVDQELGRLLERLRDYGLEGKTIVVFAGTNGEGLGEKGEDYHGTTLQQVTTHVPLVVVGPGFGAGRTVDDPVSLIDVAPTILEMTGASGLPEGDARSLTGEPDPRRPIFMETIWPRDLFGWAPLAGVIEGGWKYVDGPSPALFDLEADPGETQDRSGAEAEIAARMSGMVSGYAARRPEPDPPAEAIEMIRSLGFAIEPAPRDPRDPYGAVAVANDALRAARTIRRGQLQATEFLLGGIQEADPTNYTGLMTAVQAVGAGRDIAEARRLLERARDLYPLDAEVYHQLGHLVLSEDKDRERANKLFEVAAALDPKNEEALYDVACSYSVEGRTDAALTMLERAVAEGFRDFAWMGRDSDLDSIRTDPRFVAITGAEAGAEESAGNLQPEP